MIRAARPPPRTRRDTSARTKSTPSALAPTSGRRRLDRPAAAGAAVAVADVGRRTDRCGTTRCGAPTSLVSGGRTILRSSNPRGLVGTAAERCPGRCALDGFAPTEDLAGDASAGRLAPGTSGTAGLSNDADPVAVAVPCAATMSSCAFCCGAALVCAGGETTGAGATELVLTGSALTLGVGTAGAGAASTGWETLGVVPAAGASECGAVRAGRKPSGSTYPCGSPVLRRPK